MTLATYFVDWAQYRPAPYTVRAIDSTVHTNANATPRAVHSIQPRTHSPGASGDCVLVRLLLPAAWDESHAVLGYRSLR